MVSLTLWLVPDSGLLSTARRGVPVGGWVLQVLITGNLAAGLLWVWLDWLAWRRGLQPPETRGNLALVALAVAAGITFLCLILAETHRNNEVFGMALCLALPTLAVLLPLLWLTVRRIESVRPGTLILAGFVAACALVQGRVDDSPGPDGENLFVLNSYLMGLAVAVWLLSWATPHELKGRARLSQRAVRGRCDSGALGQTRPTSDDQLLAPLHDSETLQPAAGQPPKTV